ncbi:ras guanine nucleotide exchange factor domain-containing protein [Aspergillus pseudoustus]|uniref:Ras guanine nucleotide exchange factor domain-containing protein n=1 Tax=Aspergillus pseudoustus TaxID=1810923 RepID=A0ABR4JDB5_9EURO
MDAADSYHVEFPQRISYDYVGDVEVVKAGSLEGLVDNLTRPDKLDAAFNRTFLTTYNYFTSGTELIRHLLQRFEYQPTPPAILSATDASEWMVETHPLVRVRVVNILRQWLESFWAEPEGPETHKNLLTLQLFVSHLTATTSESSATKQQLLDLIRCRLTGVERTKRSQPSISNPPKPILPRKLTKLQLLKIDPREIARQLTLTESSMFGKIRPRELMHKSWQRKEEGQNGLPPRAPNVRALIRYFNQLSSWVGGTILAEADLKRRTQVIGHLVNVASACRDLHNYSAVVSILSGLESAPIYRLGRTWAMVTERTCSTLEPLQALTSSDQNYQIYRNTLRQAVPPCIPFLGLFLKDLVFIEDGNSATTPEGLINFSKYTMLASTAHELQGFQQASYNLTPVPELQEYLATQLQAAAAGDAHEMWERSCQLEPRGRGDQNKSRDTYTATGGMTTSMVVACMVLDD